MYRASAIYYVYICGEHVFSIYDDARFVDDDRDRQLFLSTILCCFSKRFRLIGFLAHFRVSLHAMYGCVQCVH